MSSNSHSQSEALAMTGAAAAKDDAKSVNNKSTFAAVRGGLNLSYSFTDLCRQVIVANLERYPPQAWSRIDQEEWENIVTLRHTKTAPKSVQGRFKGSGRLTPAISHKCIACIEAANPHLHESKLVDVLVWKDCVNFTFRSGGLMRPRALEYPWPILVETVKEYANNLQSTDVSLRKAALEWLQTLPMNVTLLQATGVGKCIRQAIKKCKVGDECVENSKEHCQKLTALMEKWKTLAANAGVEMSGTTASLTNNSECSQTDKDEYDLQLAETCQSWRHLYNALQHLEDTRRSSQGKRMREIRNNLNQGRPKVVKVRPTGSYNNKNNTKHSLGHIDAMRSSQTPQQAKLSQIRHEAAVVSQRSKPPPTAASSTKNSFGAAVAFCNTKSKHKTGGTVLPGNKRIVIPTKVTQAAGPRQFASKYKKTK